MSLSDEAQEIKEIKEVKEISGGIAAFFDLDGTLTALPSLERRLFRILRYRKEIPAQNYFLWIAEAIRLLPKGISSVLQSNKMHLRGVRVFNESGSGECCVSAWHKDGRPWKGPTCLGVNRANQAEGQASLAPPPRIRRLPVPSFFPGGIERVAWHARQGHEIVLVSGTLEPLAQAAAKFLEAALAARGVKTRIYVFATWLEEANGRWNGRILGAAMFGEAKAHTARKFAAERNLDLSHCFAYGDSAQDRWLLSAVGKPVAVNPSAQLQRVSRQQGWRVLHWSGKKESTQRNTAESPQRMQRQKVSSVALG